ncbi:hypothetical protein PRIC2_009109 [Phytophthora ramorum]
MEQDLSYSYASKPRPVQTSRGKARDAASKATPTNIMHDPRIPRGSVFAPINTARPADGREKAVPSYGFTSISLEANLVEQTQPTPERESFSQTDAFLPRSGANQGNATTNDMFMRPKIGIDISTQIEESDGLFNFDVEEEQEMQMLHRQHEVLKAEKSDARQGERELEDKAKEANRRKELTKKKKAEKQQRELVMRKKLFAWQFARPLVSEAFNQATSTLQKKGVFYDPILRHLAMWLAGDVYEGADCQHSLASAVFGSYWMILSYTGFDDNPCLHNCFQTKVRLWFGYCFGIHSSYLFRRKLLKVPESLSVSVIGPIALSRTDSLESIENRIKEWIEEHVGCPVDIPVGGFLSLLQLAKTI